MSIIQEISKKIHAGLNKHFAWLDLILLLLLTVYIQSGMNLIPFHGDESAFIFMSQDYDRIVKQGDLRRIYLSPAGSMEQSVRLTTGSILSLSIGFARDITNTEGPIPAWDWDISWEENILRGNLPNPWLLRLARTCSALMGALSVVLLFMTVRQLFAPSLTAWTAVVVFATQGEVLVNFRRAMQEGPKFLFLILTLYIASYILKDFQGMKMRRVSYVLLGIASGLTLAAKQDTAPMLIAIYLALAFIPVWKKEAVRTILINVLYLGAATILAGAFFLALMPIFWAWWKSAVVLIGFVTILFQLPVWKNDRAAKLLALASCALLIGMTIASPTLWAKFPTPIKIMIDTRKSLLKGQVEYYRGNNPFSFVTLQDRLLFLLETTMTSKVLYMEVPDFDIPPVHEQIATYEASPVSGRTGSLLVDGLVAVLVVIGGWALLRQINAESLLIYSLLITSGVLLFAMIPLPWQRYYLIMQIPYSILAGAGVNQIWIWGNFNQQAIK